MMSMRFLAFQKKRTTKDGFAFLQLIDERFRNSQSLPWDPDFPLEILKKL
jgi:hypothetical protein